MTYNEVQTDSYVYRQLKERFPQETVFYSRYEDGDYYNTAKTFYYDSTKKELLVDNHGCYG